MSLFQTSICQKKKAEYSCQVVPRFCCWKSQCSMATINSQNLIERTVIYYIIVNNEPNI